MKTIEQIQQELRAPFPKQDLEFRVGRSGVGKKGPWASLLAYITSRAVFDRLDAVVGIDCWKLTQRREGNGFICSLSLKLNGEWVVKEDGAEDTDIESYKGSLSGAAKRAAVLWGIGNYLYNVGDTWAKIVPEQTDVSRYAKTKDGTEFHWEVDWAKFPKWALPTEAETNKLVEDKSLANLKAMKESLEPGIKEESGIAPKAAGKEPLKARVVVKSAPAKAEPPAFPGGARENTPSGAGALEKIEAKKSLFQVIRQSLESATTLDELRQRFTSNTGEISKLPQGDIETLLMLKDMRKDELSKVVNF